MSMKRRRTAKDLQECLTVALPLLAKARELLEEDPKHHKDSRNVSTEKTGSEDDEGECSHSTNPNFDMNEDIGESLMRHSVKMCKISGKLFEAVARDVVPGRQRGEVTSIGLVKQLVCDAELAMGVEFSLLKADLDRHSDDPSRR